MCLRPACWLLLGGREPGPTPAGRRERRADTAMMPEKLQAARLKLAQERPYLGAALWAAVPVERPGIGSLAMDRWWRLYYDPAVAALPVDGLAGVLYHAICHLLRSHPERLEGYENLVANLASDAEINDDLREEKVLLPGGAVYPDMFDPPLPEGGLAEERILRRASPAQAAQGGARLPGLGRVRAVWPGGRGVRGGGGSGRRRCRLSPGSRPGGRGRGAVPNGWGIQSGDGG